MKAVKTVYCSVYTVLYNIHRAHCEATATAHIVDGEVQFFSISLFLSQVSPLGKKRKEEKTHASKSPCTARTPSVQRAQLHESRPKRKRKPGPAQLKVQERKELGQAAHSAARWSSVNGV